MTTSEEACKKFRDLVEGADRKYARVRDVPSHVPGLTHQFHKVFKAYTKLWKFQQENRAKLVESGLQRWEIGEIASRIGQLYFEQYMRTSETRFLLESYVFYDAIRSRGYFEASKNSTTKKKKEKGLAVRFKELRFYARFLLVALLLNRHEIVRALMDRLSSLVDESQSSFRDTSFKEWRMVVSEITRFVEADSALTRTTKSLRYCPAIDSHPSSQSHVARFHASRVLKLKDALLLSYHPDEVKFGEITLDTFRMIQCLEWEPSAVPDPNKTDDSGDGGSGPEVSGPSGLIDVQLADDVAKPGSTPNPRKLILHRPSVTHFLAVLAGVCEELPPDRLVLLYVSASGYISRETAQEPCLAGSGVGSRSNGALNRTSRNHVWLGPKPDGSVNTLRPSDILPFTRKPMFLIVDSDSSHAFKVLCTAGPEPVSAALLLSPPDRRGTHFTLFLTCPLRAFLHLTGLSSTDTLAACHADGIMASAFAEWEVLLCTSAGLDLAWAQVMSDPFLRRLLLRFIFCRAVMAFFHPPEETEARSPVCLPDLPRSVSPSSAPVKDAVILLTRHYDVSGRFHFE